MAFSARRSMARERSKLTTLAPASGLITSVRDFAWFDLELKNGLLLRAETVDLAWNPAIGTDGSPLPHGLDWFVESFRGQPVVWQFGVSANASSSLLATLPSQGLTFVVLANSDGLVSPFTLADGGLTQSPFARVFVELFVR